MRTIQLSKILLSFFKVLFMLQKLKEGIAFMKFAQKTIPYKNIFLQMIHFRAFKTFPTHEQTQDLIKIKSSGKNRHSLNF